MESLPYNYYIINHSVPLIFFAPMKINDVWSTWQNFKLSRTDDLHWEISFTIQFWIIREVLIFKDIGQSRRRGVNPSQPPFSSTHRHGLTLWCAGNIEDQLHFFLDKPAGSSSDHFFFFSNFACFQQVGVAKNSE